MKRFLLTFSFCSVVLIGCVSPLAGKDSHFHPAELRKEKLGPTELNIWGTYHLTDNEVMAIGTDTSQGIYVLYLIDKRENRVVSRWDFGDYGMLYKLRTKSYIVLLWEVELEYFSWLPLYVFSLENKQLTYVGDLDVGLKVDYYAEYTPYPVQDIDVKNSDTLLTFKFTKRLEFKPGDSGSRVADSLVYELNLHTNVLTPTKIWGSDTSR